MASKFVPLEERMWTVDQLIENLGESLEALQDAHRTIKQLHSDQDSTRETLDRIEGVLLSQDYAYEGDS